MSGYRRLWWTVDDLGMSTARDPKARGFVFSFYFSCKGGGNDRRGKRVVMVGQKSAKEEEDMDKEREILHHSSDSPGHSLHLQLCYCFRSFHAAPESERAAKEVTFWMLLRVRKQILKGYLNLHILDITPF